MRISLRLKDYTLTDGVNDFHFKADTEMSEAMANKLVELIDAWRESMRPRG